MDKLLEMKLDGVTFDHLASVYEEYTGKIAVENLRPSWLIFSDGFKKSATLAAGKRTLDVVASLVGLFLAAGHLFGNLPFVKRNFSKVILAIIVVSVLPIVWEWWKHRREASARADAGPRA